MALRSFLPVHIQFRIVQVVGSWVAAQIGTGSGTRATAWTASACSAGKDKKTNHDMIISGGYKEEF